MTDEINLVKVYSSLQVWGQRERRHQQSLASSARCLLGNMLLSLQTPKGLLEDISFSNTAHNLEIFIAHGEDHWHQPALSIPSCLQWRPPCTRRVKRKGHVWPQRKSWGVKYDVRLAYCIIINKHFILLFFQELSEGGAHGSSITPFYPWNNWLSIYSLIYRTFRLYGVG